MHIERVAGVGTIDAAEWRALEAPDFPFADHAFLAALERSGAASRGSGWEPQVLVARDDTGRLAGALVCYRKTNSYGEYIFDWDWARAYQANRRAYFPKLTVAVPFTPATGPKLLTSGLVTEDARRAASEALLTALEGERVTTRASSAHWLFATDDEAAALAARGWLIRHSYQYHWKNAGYATFDAFLQALSGKRRRQIVRERRQVADAGLACATLTGDQVKEEHAAGLAGFYRDTVDRKGGIAYLSEAFFAEIFQTMRERIVLTVASEGSRLVACALSFQKGAHLYGRYWGALDAYRSLHFELCYYRTIEHAIERGLTLVEAGAQGEHKLARGFLPIVTLSGHQIADPDFAAAIAQYVASEKLGIAGLVAEELAHSPYLVPGTP